jgi:hypothetical protein
MDQPASFADRLILAAVGAFFGAILGGVISVMMVILSVDARFEPMIIWITAATTAAVGLIFGYRLADFIAMLFSFVFTGFGVPVEPAQGEPERSALKPMAIASIAIALLICALYVATR